jgi:hypothetical protein
MTSFRLIAYRAILLWAATVAILAIGLWAPASAATGWKAGVAKVKITPTEPIWLAGYAARNKPSEGVLQDIWAKALALEDETGAVSVLVGADLLGFTKPMADTVAAEVAKRYGISRERLVLNASHTHSAPVTGQMLRPAYRLGPEQQEVIRRYTANLLDQVVEVIGEALQQREPVELGFEQGFAGFAVNRRRVGHREYPGPVDHDVPVLSVRRAGGDLIAIVFGYACHATVLSDYEVNGDWPGFAQEAIEKAHPGAVALFVAGCGADQNPLPRRKAELAGKYGEILAVAVDFVLEGKMKTVTGPLSAALELVELPFQPVPTREEFRQRLRTGTDAEKNHAEHMLDILDREGKIWDRYPYPVQVWQFGDTFTFISLAGEVVVDYALRFKKKYGWDDTWVSGYNNDVFAYIPSLRVLKEGGYEGGGAMLYYGQPGPFAELVEELIAEKVDRVVRRTTGGE